MKFPNAHKGLKKVFIAEIISVISAVILVVAATLVTLSANNPNEGLVVAGGAISLVAGIATVVALIIQLIGLHQGGKDEPYFRIGFWVVIFAIVLRIVSAILGAIKGVDLSLPIRLIDSVGDVASTILIGYILLGIGSLASQLNNDAMAERSKFLVYVVIALFVGSIILSIVPTFFKEPSSVGATTFLVFGIIAAILELILYIMCLIHIARAIKMLED